MERNRILKQKERMLNGELYMANDPEIFAAYKQSQKLLWAINRYPNIPSRKIEKLKSKLFGHYGSDSFIAAPLYSDYGKNTFFGRRFYANYDCIFLDVCRIDFGDDVFVGPRCSFITALHPIDKDVRNTRLEAGKPITVGSSCWFGANVTVLPGVKIGDDVVIGAGSVVKKDLPSHTVCVGNPCHPIRTIGPEDRKKWSAQQLEWERIFGQL